MRHWRSAAAGALIAVAASGCGTSRQPALTGKIVLDHAHVAVGKNLGGSLVFYNRTSRKLVMLRASACGHLYDVTLRSPAWTQPVTFMFDCGPKEALIAEPGRTVYRFTIWARSRACNASGSPGPSLCRKDADGNRDVMPSAPPGRYETVFTPSAKWNGPAIKAATLLVTRAN